MIKSFKYFLTICLTLSAIFAQTAEIYFGDVDLDNNAVDVMYNSSIEIGGAQFNLVGATLVSYSGGEAASAGWTVSGSGSTWLGFSFSGATLPTGNNILSEISFTPINEEICLSAVVFSDNFGNTIDVNIGDCVSLSGGSDVEGCTDISACNYDETATIDCNGDNSCCEFAQMYYDCDGNCLNDENGNGICDEEEVEGCTDEDACNYDETATIDCNGNNSCCEFAQMYYDCDGNCLNDENGNGICDEEEVVEGCTDEDALNYGSESDCLFDPFDEWIQSTSQSFYDIQSLTVNGIELTADDSLFVIGAFCGDSVQVGSVQWTGTGTMIVVMGPDGVTVGTENYCYEGLETPVFIPADVPYFKVWDAENDEFLDASFEVCTDSQGYESDCAWANFGYNSIQNISAGEEPIEGCTDMAACNYDDQASIDCNGDNSCCEYADEHYDCEGNCENDSDGDQVCDELEVIGCMDETACNYDEQATDDGECFYEEDCNGECGGNAEYDDCGICDGDNSTCVTFDIELLGMYSEANCSGDIVDTVTGLCDFNPYFGTEEECIANGGSYISLPVCLDIFTFSIVDEYENIDDCMCGTGGQWDYETEECLIGTQGLNMWMDEITLFNDEEYDGPESISLLYDEFNNPTNAIINNQYAAECHWDYGPSPDEYVCEQYGGEWNDYDMECQIDDEGDCNELGGYWQDTDNQILTYSVDWNNLILEDDGEEIMLEIINTEGGTALVSNMPEGSCEFVYYPTEEECANANLDWNDYDMECDVDDEDSCNDLGGEWIEEGCFAMVFDNQQSNIFGCTEEGNPSYNAEAVINDGSCSLSSYEQISPKQFFLSENYPNPFNPITQFSYTIPEYTYIELSIYDIQGNLVKTIYNGNHEPGQFKVTIDGSEFASGFYVTVLNAGDVVLSQKMTLLK